MEADFLVANARMEADFLVANARMEADFLVANARMEADFSSPALLSSSLQRASRRSASLQDSPHLCLAIRFHFDFL